MVSMSASARYDDLGRGRGYKRKSADSIYMAGKSAVDAAIMRAGDRLIDAIKANTLEGPVSDGAEAQAASRAAESWTMADAGKTFKRRNIYAGSFIRVGLAIPEGGSYSAALVEYGQGGIGGWYPATKALFELGGRT